MVESKLTLHVKARAQQFQEHMIICGLTFPTPQRHQYKLNSVELGKSHGRRGSTDGSSCFDRIKRIFELKELTNEAKKRSFRSS